MTVVEFFDENFVENVVSMLVCFPQKIILIGDNKKRMNRCAEAYRAVAQDRKIETEIICESVIKNDLQNIIDKLSDICEANDDLAFDLTGGDDLCLVATGIVYEKYRHKVSLHRYNVINGRMIDCDCDGKLVARLPSRVSIEENVQIYGGRIIYEDEKPNTTYRWSFTEEFKDDVLKIWDICRGENTPWNIVLTNMESYTVGEPSAEDLDVTFSRAAIRSLLISRNIRLDFVDDLLSRFRRYGFINNFRTRGNEISFTYKNHDIKRLLTKAGTVLELFITVMAMGITDKGEPLYTDVMNGVFVDWDGQRSEDNPDVENEIDVMLMKDMLPFFISCKNGTVNVEELYKLHTVAQRFGGIYARKVLVLTELDRETDHGKYILLRAKDMDVTVIDNVCKMPIEEVQKNLKKLYRS